MSNGTSHDNLNEDDYIEKDDLELITIVVERCPLASISKMNFTVLQPHFPRYTGPMYPGLSYLNYRSCVHDFSKELVSPLY